MCSCVVMCKVKEKKEAEDEKIFSSSPLDICPEILYNNLGQIVFSSAYSLVSV